MLTTDGIINKLVMVFAICSYYQDRFVTNDKPGPHHSNALNL